MDKNAISHPIRILIADDHAVVREGLEAILEAQPDMILVGAATNGEEAVSLAGQTQPDVIL
ncbi:MAG: response regulator, partial [Chloroflexi bacterium]|nr:response regulator [Chloroflexota bacterium]